MPAIITQPHLRGWRALCLALAGTALAAPAVAQQPPPSAPPQGGAPSGPPGGGPGGPPAAPVTITPAILIKDGVYVPDPANARAILGGGINNGAAADLAIASHRDGFNGIYVRGAKSSFTLSNANIALFGNGSGHNDNAGYASGALAGAGATLTLRNVTITTYGIVSNAATSTGGSVLKVYDSVLIAHGGTVPKGSPPPSSGPGSIGPPRALGVLGTARATDTTDGAKSYFYNSTIIADAWGALSTDEAGKGVYLEADDCDIQVKHTGYGTYADNGAEVLIKNSTMNIATYLAVVAGTGKMHLHGITGTSADVGVMLHNVGNDPTQRGLMDIAGGSIHARNAVILIKSASPDVSVDGTRMTSDSSLLLHSVINADADAARPKNGAKNEGAKVVFNHMALAGSVARDDSERPLVLSLVSTRLSGAITGGVELSLDAESRWRATENSSVTLEGNVSPAQISAPAGVTIAAVAGNGDGLKGNYKLAGGGELSVAQ